MFTQEPELCTTWVSLTKYTQCRRRHTQYLSGTTTYLNDGNLNFCVHRYIKLQLHQVPHETIRELSKQGKLFKDILQRVILPARFEDARPSGCRIICMWIDGLKNTVTYVMFDRHREPQLKLEYSPVYLGMTAGVCCTPLSSSPITAPFPIPYPFEQEDK